MTYNIIPKKASEQTRNNKVTSIGIATLCTIMVVALISGKYIKKYRILSNTIRVKLAKLSVKTMLSRKTKCCTVYKTFSETVHEKGTDFARNAGILCSLASVLVLLKSLKFVKFM